MKRVFKLIHTYIVLWIGDVKMMQAIRMANEEYRNPTERVSAKECQNYLYVSVFNNRGQRRLYWCSVWNYRHRLSHSHSQALTEGAIEKKLKRNSFYVTLPNRTYEEEQNAIRDAKQKYRNYLKKKVLCLK